MLHSILNIFIGYKKIINLIQNFVPFILFICLYE